jgi:GNAT superfamily N-acetyltransferase
MGRTRKPVAVAGSWQCAGRVEIKPFGVDEYDERIAGAVAATHNAALAVDAPHEVPLSERGHLLRLRHGWDGHGPEVVLVGYDGGEVVGHATVEISHWEDNQHLAWLEVTVTPSRRRHGYGHTLLTAAEEWSVHAGKTLLAGGTWQGSAGDGFARAHGYEPGLLEVQRRLDLETLDRDHIHKLHAEAGAKATDFELVRLVGSAPQGWLPDLVEVVEAINDAPLDDLEIEDEVFSVERLRLFDAAQAARGHVLYRLMARRVEDGAWAGHTIIAVDRDRPWFGDQLDTSVVRSHRGHRLGLLLKTEMLQWLHAEEPQLRMIDTWNAASNQHMIAVNDQLGFRVVGRSVDWQRRV